MTYNRYFVFVSDYSDSGLYAFEHRVDVDRFIRERMERDQSMKLDSFRVISGHELQLKPVEVVKTFEIV